jgi:hypothetical protein
MSIVFCEFCGRALDGVTAKVERLRLDCENHQRVRENQRAAIHESWQECLEQRAEVERLRAAISSLIDAIQDVQCWQGTHVAACIVHACALLSDAGDQGAKP